MKVYLRWFQVVFQNCWCFTKGQFIILFQIGQGFSLELVQHLFMKNRSKLWCCLHFEFSLGLVKDGFKALFTV